MLFSTITTNLCLSVCSKNPRSLQEGEEQSLVSPYRSKLRFLLRGFDVFGQKQSHLEEQPGYDEVGKAVSLRGMVC